MPELNPAQERVLRELIDRDGPRPAVDPSLAPTLKAELIDLTAAAVEVLEMAGRTLHVSKHAVSTVMGCEERWSRDTDFAWSTRTVVGTVAHKAAELLLVGKLAGAPANAVDAAIEVLRTDDSGGDLARFLDLASPAERADLRSRAVTSVTSLVDAFPPIGSGWQARAEQTFRTWLGARTVTLTARPDLAFGRPVGPEARSLLIDFKAGRATQSDLDDGRFYALVHTLVYGVAPWRVATFYLAEAAWTAEDVDGDVLLAATRRVADAIVRMAEITCATRVAALTPGPACRWCGLRAECPGGIEWNARALDGDADEAGADRIPF